MHGSYNFHVVCIDDMISSSTWYEHSKVFCVLNHVFVSTGNHVTTGMRIHTRTTLGTTSRNNSIVKYTYLMGESIVECESLTDKISNTLSWPWWLLQHTTTHHLLSYCTMWSPYYVIKRIFECRSYPGVGEFYSHSWYVTLDTSVICI